MPDDDPLHRAGRRAEQFPGEFGQGYHSRHQGLQVDGAVGDQGKSGAKVLRRLADGAFEGHLAVVEDVPGHRQDFRRVRGRKQDDPPRLRHQPQRCFSRAPGARGDERRVCAASTGPALYRGDAIFPGDVDRAIRAETLGKMQPYAVTIEDQGLRAPHPAQEQMQQPHGPGAQDRDRIARSHASSLYRMDAAGQRLRQRHLLGRCRPGPAEQAPRRNGYELRKAAADDLVPPAARIVAPVAELALAPDAIGAPTAAIDGIEHDPVAGLEAAIVVGGIDHRPRDLVTADHGKGDSDGAGEYPAFGGADRDGAGADDHLPGRRGEAVEFLDRTLSDAGHDEGLHPDAGLRHPRRFSG